MTAPLPPVTRPLGLRLGVAALVAALLPLAVAVGLLLDVNADAVRTGARRLHTTVATDVARSVDDTFEQARRELQTVGLALVDDTHTGAERVSTAVALVAGSTALEAVGIYGLDGARIDVIGDGTSRELPARAPAVAANPEIVVDEVRIMSGVPHVLVAIPLRHNGAQTATVAAWVSLAAVQAQVERLAAISLPGYADALFVVDSARHFVAHSNPTLSSSLSVADEPMVAGVALARGASTQFVTETEAQRRDGTVVGTAIALAGAGSGFVVVAQMPITQVYASLTRMRWLAAGVVLGAVALALLGAFFVSRAITRPVRSLVDSATALAQRRFVDVQGLPKRHDELAVLGAAMSGAATALQHSEVLLLEETKLREGLGRYLPQQLVDAYVARRDRDVLAGKRAEITVLFADVVGFTPLSAQLPPEDLCALLNDLFTILTEIVFKHGGTVDKFIGDSVMAFWGAPEADADHASHAVEAARDMMRFLDVGNLRWKRRYGVEIRLAVGMNSGVAVVGNLGSEKRLVYTAIGETVNIAARLESVAGPMQILAAAATVTAAGEDDAVALGPQDLAGVARAVDVFVIEV
jgi:adenylate cyclase